MDDYAIAYRYREEAEELRERVRQLEEQLMPIDSTVDPRWGLTPLEAKIFRYIAAHDVCPVQLIVAGLYSSRADGGPTWAASTIRSHVCKARQKLAPFGIVIRTNGWRGYSLVQREAAQ